MTRAELDPEAKPGADEVPAAAAPGAMAAGAGGADGVVDDPAAEERRRRSALFHTRWLRVNLTLIVLLIVATLWQYAAIQSCSRRAQRACENADGIRLFRTVGFGPWMSCYYECQGAEQVAEGEPGAAAARNDRSPSGRDGERLVPTAAELAHGSRGNPLDTDYAQN